MYLRKERKELKNWFGDTFMDLLIILEVDPIEKQIIEDYRLKKLVLYEKVRGIDYHPFSGILFGLFDIFSQTIAGDGNVIPVTTADLLAGQYYRCQDALMVREIEKSVDEACDKLGKTVEYIKNYRGMEVRKLC